MANRETNCLHQGTYAKRLLRIDNRHEVASDWVKSFDRLGRAELLNKRIRESGQILHNHIRPSQLGQTLGGRGVLGRLSRFGFSRLGSLGFRRLGLPHFRGLWGHNRRHALER
jgi:hypothetical protein